MNERKLYVKHDIWSFKYTCFHECHEWKWGTCYHCKSARRCRDHIRSVYLSEEGIYNPISEIQVSLHHSQDLGFYVHEFTENSISQILIHFRKDWNASVEFEGYDHTFISHFITLYGANNGRCLEPVTRKNKPRW